MKYIICDYGVYPMSYFFSNSEIKDTGIGSDSVKAEIQQMIREEDPREPFSDQYIMEQLMRRGYRLSRRTIAKYRQELGISNAFERKEKLKGSSAKIAPNKRPAGIAAEEEKEEHQV